jgi:hypothetical protein
MSRLSVYSFVVYSWATSDSIASAKLDSQNLPRRSHCSAANLTTFRLHNSRCRRSALSASDGDRRDRLSWLYSLQSSDQSELLRNCPNLYSTIESFSPQLAPGHSQRLCWNRTSLQWCSNLVLVVGDRIVWETTKLECSMSVTTVDMTTWSIALEKQ